MLGLRPSELVVTIMLALVILGPKKFPEMAKSVMKMVREFKEASRGLRDAVQKDVIEPITSFVNESMKKDSEDRWLK